MRRDVDDGKDRGLQFIAYCSSIEEQFEFLQRKWANTSHGPTDPGCVDPIIGQVAPGARHVAEGVHGLRDGVERVPLGHHL